jgi:hypothetical protein
MPFLLEIIDKELGRLDSLLTQYTTAEDKERIMGQRDNLQQALIDALRASGTTSIWVPEGVPRV